MRETLELLKNAVSPTEGNIPLQAWISACSVSVSLTHVAFIKPRDAGTQKRVANSVGRWSGPKEHTASLVWVLELKTFITIPPASLNVSTVEGWRESRPATAPEFTVTTHACGGTAERVVNTHTPRSVAPCGADMHTCSPQYTSGGRPG